MLLLFLGQDLNQKTKGSGTEQDPSPWKEGAV